MVLMVAVMVVTVAVGRAPLRGVGSGVAPGHRDRHAIRPPRGRGTSAALGLKTYALMTAG